MPEEINNQEASEASGGLWMVCRWRWCCSAGYCAQRCSKNSASNNTANASSGGTKVTPGASSGNSRGRTAAGWSSPMSRLQF